MEPHMIEIELFALVVVIEIIHVGFIFKYFYNLIDEIITTTA